MSKILNLKRDFMVFGFLLLLCAIVAMPAQAGEAGRI